MRTPPKKNNKNARSIKKKANKEGSRRQGDTGIRGGEGKTEGRAGRAGCLLPSVPSAEALTLEGLQRGDVSGAQPGGVAAQDSLQVVGGVAK